MKIQLTHNFGTARGVQSVVWFESLLDAQDWAVSYIRKHMPLVSQAKMIDEVESCNVKGLTNLLSNVNLFKFEWVK